MQSRSDHDDLGADIDPTVEVDHVFVAHPDATGRDRGADGPWLVGAVNAIERRAEIHRARAEWIFRPAFHVTRQIRPSLEHFRWRCPGRPFLLGGNRFYARLLESGLADA